MGFLRQSTEVIIRVGPFVDAVDALTPQVDIGNPDTDLTGVDEAELLKAGGGATVDITSNTWAAVANCDGWYNLTLTAGNTDTVGELVVVIQDDSDCLPVFQKFQVIEEAVYDELFKAAATGAQGAIVTNNLDHLMKVPVSDRENMPEVVDDTVLANIITKTDGDTSDYNHATDSLEGIADGAGAGLKDWSDAERAQIRSAVGVDGDKTTATGGHLQDIRKIARADKVIDTTKTPWVLDLKEEGTENKLVSKTMKNTNGENITSDNNVLGQLEQE